MVEELAELEGEPQPEQLTDEDLLRLGVTDLASRLRQEPEFVSRLRAVFESVLATPSTTESFQSLASQLSDYVGDNVFSLLMVILTTTSLDEDLRSVEEVEGVDNLDEIVSLLRWLRALYGTAVYEIYGMWQENPDDWKELDRKVYFDQLAHSWVLSIEIIKYDRDRVKIVGSPTSILNLSRMLLAGLNAITEPSPFLQPRLDLFRTELDTFRDKFLAEPKAPLEAEPEPELEPEPEPQTR
jgi:hypothetical protein